MLLFGVEQETDVTLPPVRDPHPSPDTHIQAQFSACEGSSLPHDEGPALTSALSTTGSEPKRQSRRDDPSRFTAAEGRKVEIL